MVLPWRTADVKHAGLVFSLIFLLTGCISTQDTVKDITTNSEVIVSTYNDVFTFQPLTETGNSIDEIILECLRYILSRIPINSRITVMPIQSSSDSLGNYISDNLLQYLVNNDRYTIIESAAAVQRQNNRSLNNASDETYITIGRQISTQSIITGAITPLGENYSLRIKIINIETTQIIGTQIFIIKPDNVLLSLLNTPNEITEEPAVRQINNTPAQQVNIENVNIINNNTTTIQGDVYVNMPSGFGR